MVMNPKTEAARRQMIEQQVRTWNVLDPRVLETLAAVPRENFVPEAYRAVAFADAADPDRTRPIHADSGARGQDTAGARASSR